MLVWLSLLAVTLLTMSKLRGGFNYRWEYVFSPLIVAMMSSGIWHTYLLIEERTMKAEYDKSCPFQLFIHEHKGRVYDILIPAFESFTGLLILLDLSEFLNRAMLSKERHPRADLLCLTLLASFGVSMLLRLMRSAHQKSIEMILEDGEEYYLEWRKNTRFLSLAYF